MVVHLDRSSGILTLERWINALPEPKSPSKSVASDADLNPVPQCVESRFIDLNEEAPTVSSLEPFMLVAYDELTLNEAEPANDVYITESQLVHYAEGVASRLF